MDDTPLSNPDDPPFFTVSYNQDWRPLVLFALYGLHSDYFWREGSNNSDVDFEKVDRLIERFAGTVTNIVDIDFSAGLEGLTLVGGALDATNHWVIGTGGNTVEVRYTAAAGKTLYYAEMEYYSNRPSGTNGNIRTYEPNTTHVEKVNQGVGWDDMHTGLVSVSVTSYVRFAVNPDATNPNENKIKRIVMHLSN